MSKKGLGFWGWVLIIILILITAGLILAADGENEPTQATPKDEDEETKLRNRIKAVEDKILPLEAKREELRLREKRLLIRVRLLISCSILGGNLAYLYWCNTYAELGKQLNFNEAGLLIYSFFAFMISGTPSKFVFALKKGAVKRLNRKHLPMLVELETLERERKQLHAELDLLLKSKNK